MKVTKIKMDGHMENRASAVAIIVLNWNNWWDTVECLTSLKNLEYEQQSILIVDNGSRNDSWQRIEDWIRHEGAQAMVLNEKDLPIREMASRWSAMANDALPKYLLLGLKENHGYAGGNNIAIEGALLAGYDYVWLLNNDTIVTPDSLQELVSCAERDRRTGIVASYNVNIISDRPLPVKGSHFLDRCLESKSVEGASILVKAGCLRDIGPIDEKYFCYFEDLDLSFRARRNGWKLFYNFRSIVFHKWGSSAGSRRIEKWILGKTVIRIIWEGFPIPGYYCARNGIYFEKKNRPFFFIPYVLIRTLHLILQIFLYDDHKWGRIKIIIRGTWDGVLGRMGKADILN
jgi:GT2 family glycosyltransferase